MTTAEFDADYENPDENQPDPANPQGPKELREAFSRVSTENVTLKRELAFTKADLPDTPQVQLLRDNYKGEFTREAIRKEALKYGLIDAEGDVPEAELQAQERVQQLGQGASPVKNEPDMNQAIRRASGR